MARPSYLTPDELTADTPARFKFVKWDYYQKILKNEDGRHYIMIKTPEPFDTLIYEEPINRLMWWELLRFAGASRKKGWLVKGDDYPITPREIALRMNLSTEEFVLPALKHHIKQGRIVAIRANSTETEESEKTQNNSEKTQNNFEKTLASADQEKRGEERKGEEKIIEEGCGRCEGCPTSPAQSSISSQELELDSNPNFSSERGEERREEERRDKERRGEEKRGEERRREEKLLSKEFLDLERVNIQEGGFRGERQSLSAQLNSISQTPDSNPNLPLEREGKASRPSLISEFKNRFESKEVEKFIQNKFESPSAYRDRLLRIADVMLEKIQETNSKRFSFLKSKPLQEAWKMRTVLAFDRLLRNRGVLLDELRAALEWIFVTDYKRAKDFGDTASFHWFNVVQSGDNLLKNWDKILPTLEREKVFEDIT